MTSKLRIWHVGNWCIHIGQKYVESPFEAPSKDVEVLNYAQPFVDALQSDSFGRSYLSTLLGALSHVPGSF